MREKLIDIALIVTLIIVAFGITWTLLTLNRSQARPSNRQPAAERTVPNSGEITPLPVDPAPGSAVAPARSGGPRDQRDAAGTRAGTEGGEASQAEARQASVADPDPVPPGPVRLERVGFSFATGGAGACGITLEPWEHVAVSRELLSAYGCGAEVTLTLDEEKGGRRQLQAIIGDTMNPVHSRTVNIYVGEDEPALQYGVTTGVLRP
jgi:3D (Asp-Asp-Asp) domain-containing protein